MQSPRQSKCRRDAVAGGKTEQPLPAIELHIHRRVDEVKPERPAQDGARQKIGRRRGEVVCDRRPCPHRRSAQGQPQEEMRTRGKPFCDGIKEDQRQHYRTEDKAKSVQHPCAKNRQSCSDEQENPGVRLLNERMPAGRAWILLVDLPVH